MIHTDDTAGYYAWPQCAPIMQNPQVSPLLYWNHWTTTWAGFTGNCAAGAVPYTGKLYPAAYQGDSNNRAVFIADFGGQWIQVIWVDANDNFIESSGVQQLLSGLGPLCAMKADPVSGDIYYVRIDGQIHRIVHPTAGGVNNPPTVFLYASVLAQNVALQGPMTVNFSSDNSYDVDGNQIWMHWDFGDGTHSDEANPVHVYTVPGVWTVTLTVMDSLGATSTRQTTIKCKFFLFFCA